MLKAQEATSTPWSSSVWNTCNMWCSHLIGRFIPHGPAAAGPAVDLPMVTCADKVQVHLTSNHQTNIITPVQRFWRKPSRKHDLNLKQLSDWLLLWDSRHLCHFGLRGRVQWNSWLFTVMCVTGSPERCLQRCERQHRFNEPLITAYV